MMNSRRKTQWNLDWLDRNEYESDKHTPHDFDKLVDSVMGQDSGISESDVFISEFSSDDVNDLKNVLISYKPIQNRYTFQKKLELTLHQWCNEHHDSCPYEPFLWALKCVDGYVGSIKYNAVPQEWIIRGVCNALRSVWKSSYRDVLKHIITKWDWYQPIHVALFLYGELRNVNDEEIDEYIREQWLYRVLYCRTALNTLCQKQRSEENIHALMQFVSRDKHTDFNRAQLDVTKHMRETVQSYLKSLSDNQFSVAKTYFNDYLYNCSRTAKGFFEEIFGIRDADQNVPDFLEKWNDVSNRNNHIGELRLELSNILNSQKSSTELINIAASGKNSALRQEIIRILERNFDFFTQFKLIRIIAKANVCSEYRDFIANKYNNTAGGFYDNEKFAYGCAYCCIGHSDIMFELVQEFFFNISVSENAKYIFHQLRTYDSQEFNKCIDKLVDMCLDNMEYSLEVISNCAVIYKNKMAVQYPKAFNTICNMLMKRIIEEKTDAPRYGNVLIELYESIVTVYNRTYYYDALNAMSKTKSFALRSMRERAQKKITSLYQST